MHESPEPKNGQLNRVPSSKARFVGEAHPQGCAVYHRWPRATGRRGEICSANQEIAPHQSRRFGGRREFANFSLDRNGRAAHRAPVFASLATPINS